MLIEFKMKSHSSSSLSFVGCCVRFSFSLYFIVGVEALQKSTAMSVFYSFTLISFDNCFRNFCSVL